jgi:hypothetical protein
MLGDSSLKGLNWSAEKWFLFGRWSKTTSDMEWAWDNKDLPKLIDNLP